MRYNLIIIVLCIIIIFFMSRHCAFLSSSTVGTISSCMIYPVLRIQQFVIEPLQLWLQKRVSFKDLQQFYNVLQKEYTELLAENIALKSMKYYVQETQELLNFKKRYSSKNGCLAQILARHLSMQHQFFLVNAGSSHGIKKDMVALYKNCLIGKVIEVYPWYCKVCLITDFECKVAALCSKTGATGILEGSNNTNSMILNYVNHLATVEEHDMMISSGDGLIFPYGFGLGTITYAKKGDLFYEITVTPLLDFSSLCYCILIAKDEIEKC